MRARLGSGERGLGGSCLKCEQVFQVVHRNGIFANINNESKRFGL